MTINFFDGKNLKFTLFEDLYYFYSYIVESI